MKLKIFLLLISATLVGTGIWLKWEERKEILAAVEAHKRPWTSDFDLNDVTEVFIKTNEDSLLLQRAGNSWAIGGKDINQNANVAAIGQLVQRIKTLKPVEELDVSPLRFADFNLLEPDGVSSGTGTFVELRNRHSERIAAVIIGKKSFAPPEPGSPFPPTPNGRFILPANSKGPVGVASEGFDQISPNPEAWVDEAEAH